jgi:hypothetical protein
MPGVEGIYRLEARTHEVCDVLFVCLSGVQVVRL